MAKKSLVARNLKRIRMVEKYAKKRGELKRIISSPQATDEEFFRAQRALAELPKNSNRTRVRNRCVITGRSRGVHSRFGISRLVLRELVAGGCLPGVIKASW
ncbi:MAG: 30S ribosomal protein S14 [Puniceicoccales bacterium]|jgi:small subunit ribosomal protein S14|nr:30S ribosomal protein S14 [Puniceicoccales bacterium]